MRSRLRARAGAVSSEVQYCVDVPDEEEPRCFQVGGEARRFARKYGYPPPRTVVGASA